MTITPRIHKHWEHLTNLKLIEQGGSVMTARRMSLKLLRIELKIKFGKLVEHLNDGLRTSVMGFFPQHHIEIVNFTIRSLMLSGLSP